MNMVWKKKNLRRHKYEKAFCPCFFIGEWISKLANTRQQQQIKCGIGFNAFGIQCPKWNFFYYTRIMINVVSVKNFKEKNVMQWLKSSLQRKGPRFNPYFNFFANKQNG